VPVPPTSGLIYVPATEILVWTDAHGSHNGNLAAFNATADYASVTDFDFAFLGNGITSITGLNNFPNLTNLESSSELLTTLDITGLAHLASINVSSNNLTVAAVNAILTTLDANGLHNGTVILNAQTPAAVPTGAGLTSAIALIDKGWTVTVDMHALASSWKTRATVNGGAPTVRSALVLTGFSQAIDTASLTAHFKALNCFVPDDLASAITPLIVGGGSDPWTNHNFIAGDLTVAGLKGNGTNKYLETGINPSVAFAGAGINSAGITLYNTYPDNTPLHVDSQVLQGATNSFMLQCNESGSSRFDCFTNNTGARLICESQNGGLAFYSANRVDAANQFLYQAAPGLALFQAGSNAGGPGVSLPNGILPVFCWDSVNGTTFDNFSFHRYSFAAIHDGFSQANCLALYTAVDAMRNLFGGGNLQDNLSVVAGIHPTVKMWRYSVKALGGADPSLNTLNALTTFMNALDTAGITASLKSINCFVPDSLTACLIPLVSKYGLQLWANHNFVGGDLSVNGLQGANTKYLDTGIVPSDFLLANSASIAIYNSIASAVACEMAGRAGGIAKIRFGFDTGSLGNYLGCWTDATNFGGGNIATAKVGYVCGVKSASNARSLYFANSTNAHAAIATNNITNESTAPDAAGNVFVMAGDEGGSASGFTTQRLSFFSLGLALSTADSANLFNAVQALRTSLGGGFV
jgi:hypothetical protein